MAAMIEHRSNPRIPLELRTAYSQAGEFVTVRNAVSRDVSLGGFLAETPSYEPFAGVFRGSFRLPGQETPLEFEARIVWSRTAGALRKCGCVFTRLADADRRRLETLLSGVWTQMLTVG